MTTSARLISRTCYAIMPFSSLTVFFCGDVVAESAAYALTGGVATVSGQTVSATATNQSAVWVTRSGRLTLNNVTLVSGGNTTNTTVSSQYGLNAVRSMLRWRPRIAQANTTNRFTVCVADSGFPSLSATQSFSVAASPATQPTNIEAGFSEGAFRVTVSGPLGPDYLIQTCTNLASADWATLVTTNPIALPFMWRDSESQACPVRFYRIRSGP